MQNIILEYKNVFYTACKDFIIQNINLKIFKGSYTLIKGPSGSGKSTLLRLACRLDEPQKGEILFDGANYKNISPQKLRNNITLIQQTPTILDGTIKDNLLLPYSFLSNKSKIKPTDDSLILKLKKLFLNEQLDRDATTLSVGQKQRLCIIRTLLLKPAIVLMDEPTSALDQESRFIVENITEELNKNGMTIIMVSHSQYVPKVDYTEVFVKNGQLEVRNNTRNNC